MDASITEDKCEGINMRQDGRDQTERTGWVCSPPWVSMGSFLLLFPVAKLCPGHRACRRGREGG